MGIKELGVFLDSETGDFWSQNWRVLDLETPDFEVGALHFFVL